MRNQPNTNTTQPGHSGQSSSKPSSDTDRKAGDGYALAGTGSQTNGDESAVASSGEAGAAVAAGASAAGGAEAGVGEGGVAE